MARTVHPLESERMRQEWLAEHSEHAGTDEDSNALVSLPLEPEVRARPARDEELGGPRSGTRQVIALAERLGFEVVATYARGPYMHSTYWTPTRTADSVVVRIVEHGRQVAVATWVDGKFEHAYWQNPREKLTSNTLKTRLKEHAS